MIGSLLWKEWREHTWKIAACMLILIVPPAAQVIFAKGRGPSMDTSPIWEIQFASSLGLTIWLAAWTLTSERNTKRVLEALPVRSWLVFAVKSLLGLATLLVPVCLAWTLTSLLLDEPSGPYPLMLLAHLYLLILAVGMGVRREGMAAMVGVLVFLSSFLVTGLLATHRGTWDRLALWFFPLFSFGSGSTPNSEVASVHAVECAAFWLIAGFRFGSVPIWRGTARPRAGTWRPGSLAVHANRSGLKALIWKEWREQRGVLIGGAASGLVIALTVALAVSEARNFYDKMEDLMVTFVFLGVGVPLMVAIVLGISGWTLDLEPGVAAFWQSRPIVSSRVFWVKYAFALAGLLLLALTFFAGAYACRMSVSTDWVPYNIDLGSQRGALGQAALWSPPLLTFTMLSAILLRRPIYAGTLAIVVCIGVASMLLSGKMGQMDLEEWMLPLAGIMFVFTVCLAVLASKSLQKNWRVAA